MTMDTLTAMWTWLAFLPTECGVSPCGIPVIVYWLWTYKKPRLRASTFDNRETVVRYHLKPALENVALQDLRPEHVPHYYNAAGVPAIWLHDARHTFATWMLEQGTPAKVVQTLLGHSSITVTMDIYSHVSLDQERQAAEALNAAFRRGLQ